MFTGIIEHLGSIARLEAHANGGKLTVHAPTLAPRLAVSASVAVNGCCLTVVHKDFEHFSADLSGETLAKTAFRTLPAGTSVNLEQPLTAGKEFGGHFVLGHVDGTGTVAHLQSEGESWNFGINIPDELARHVVSKGSITIDGISLTVARWRDPIAEIAVIPYTYTHTNIRDRVSGELVNLEVDILGKYVERYAGHRKQAVGRSSITLKELMRQGF